ncbi:unnamed protein product [Caenorhabditis brenneri]
MDDSETCNWINAHTKECPKCFVPIRKNGGCNHMTCTNKSCKFKFFWLCMGCWRSHGTSGYQCNRYDEGKDVNRSKHQRMSKMLCPNSEEWRMQSNKMYQ